MEQLKELIAEREASIAVLQAELEALRLAANLLGKRETNGISGVQNKDASGSDGAATSLQHRGLSKGQFV